MNTEKICCSLMSEAIKEKGRVPINMDRGEFPCGIEFICDDEDEKYFQSHEEYLKTFPYGDMIVFCPWCGKDISTFSFENNKRSASNNNCLCKSFLAWFDRKEAKSEPASRMFEYDHRNNQFYLHNRKGFGEGFIPIKYCIYCGEDLSEMINKYGIPEEIKDCLHTDEWWKKRGL